MTIYFWILFISLLALDLLLVFVRSSLTNARMPDLLTLREARPEAVERVIRVLEKPRVRISLYLWLVLIHFLLLITCAWTALIFFPGSVTLAASLGLAAVFAVAIILFEFALEGWVLPRSEVLALRFAPFALVLDLLISPLSSLLMLVLGPKEMLERRMNAVTEDELKVWAQEEHPEGSLEQGERRMIYSIFHFGDTLAREVMVPRMDITALEVNTLVSEATRVLSQSGHSRVPVYEGVIEHIIGLLYAKDLLRISLNGTPDDQSIASVADLLRPAYFVPETKKVDELLREMQSRSVHMAIVVDEYGGIAGLVTLEDIVEEIVGEIRDEYDESEEQLYEQVSPDEYIFTGRISMDDFNEVMGASLEKDSADTLGGFIFARIGRVPSGGEKIMEDNLTLTVEQVSGRRIRRVRVVSAPVGSETTETEKQDETER